MSEKNPSLVLQTLLGQNTKTYIVFDISGRPHLVYQAPSTAEDGTPCMLTEYIYDGVNSTTIKATKEVTSEWDSDFDAEFTV